MSWKLYPPPEDPARNILAKYSLYTAEPFLMILAPEGAYGMGKGCGRIREM